MEFGREISIDPRATQRAKSAPLLHTRPVGEKDRRQNTEERIHRRVQGLLCDSSRSIEKRLLCTEQPESVGQ